MRTRRKGNAFVLSVPFFFLDCRHEEETTFPSWTKIRSTDHALFLPCNHINFDGHRNFSLRESRRAMSLNSNGIY